MISQLHTLRIGLLNDLDSIYNFLSVIRLSETHARYDLILSNKIHFIDRILNIQKFISYVEILDHPKHVIDLIYNRYFEAMREFWLEEKVLKARLMNLWG